MAQVTSGARAILSYPFVYSAFQSLMGAHKFRKNFVANYVKPLPGMKILDLGCGPADILGYLPDVDYWGYDISTAYIAQAKKRFGQRGQFNCKQLELHDLAALPKFDVVLALGLLHHLDDSVGQRPAVGLRGASTRRQIAHGRPLSGSFTESGRSFFGP